MSRGDPLADLDARLRQAVSFFWRTRQTQGERQSTATGVRDLYDSSCLLLSSRETGPLGDFREPDSELSFRVFATQLAAHATAAVKLGR